MQNTSTAKINSLGFFPCSEISRGTDIIDAVYFSAEFSDYKKDFSFTYLARRGRTRRRALAADYDSGCEGR